MLNEEGEQYTEDDGEIVGNGDSVLEYEEDEEYQKIRRDHVFGEIDFTKRKSKIVCTLGPTTTEVEDILKLFDAGMAIARFNMSHGTAKSNQRLLRKYFEAKKLRPHKICGMMLELRGREIRTSDTQDHVDLKLKPGQELFIDCLSPLSLSTEKVLYCNYKELPRAVKPKDIIYIDDGKIVCLVTECSQRGVMVEVKGGGTLGSRKSIKLSGGKHELLPVLNYLDEVDINQYLIKCGFDFLVLPYAIRKKDIQYVKDFLGPHGAHVQILAKIDAIEALHNFEELIKSADGIILNRVEIGLELPPEKLMLAQKWMIDRCNQEGKPIFIQSQILESMITKDQCTSTEAEDITSAILEGADAFILCHETSIGKFPQAAVIQLAKAIAEGENIIDYEQVYQEIKEETMKNTKRLSAFEAMASTACNIALENNCDLFICLTENGKIARFVAKYKPFQPIIACATSSFVVRQTNMSRGVIGYKIPLFMKKQSDKLVGLVLKVAKEQGLCQAGNKVLIFYTENEGKKGENINFKLVDIEGE